MNFKFDFFSDSNNGEDTLNTLVLVFQMLLSISLNFALSAHILSTFQPEYIRKWVSHPHCSIVKQSRKREEELKAMHIMHMQLSDIILWQCFEIIRSKAAQNWKH